MLDAFMMVVKVIAYGVGYVTKAIEIGYKQGQTACHTEHVVEKINVIFGSKKAEA